MIEYRTLGLLDLRGSDGQRLDAVLAHPKRTALLTFLIVASPRGYHRRDTLLALLWPDRDERHARGSLRQALHGLRQDLGERVIAARGDEEVAIEPTEVWCDVCAFDAALERDDQAAAVALCRGPFLDGFHLRGAPEFERWVETQRARILTDCVTVYEALAANATRQGHHARAVELWQRAVNGDRYNSRLALGLAEALAASGDRANALKALHEHEEILRGELGVNAEPELLRYAERLKHTSERLEAVAARDRELSRAPTLSGRDQHPRGSTRKRRRQSWRLASRVAVWGVVVGVLAAVASQLWPRPESTYSRHVMAVAPFDVLHPELQMWGPGIMELLYYSLNGVGALRVIAPDRVADVWSGRIDPESVAAAAARLRAELLLYGVVAPRGRDSIRLAAVLVDVPTLATLAAFDLPGPRPEIDRLIDELAVQVIEQLVRSRGLAREPLQSLGSTNLAAIREFLSGQQHHRRFNGDSAVSHYRRAIALDSTFALAISRLAVTRRWHGPELTETWATVALHAGEHNRGLATRESLLIAVDSVRGALALHWPRRIYQQATLLNRLQSGIRTLLELYPDDPEVWCLVGDTYSRFATWLPNTWEERRHAYASAVSLDSSYLPAYPPLVELELLLDGPEAARGTITAYLERAPRGPGADVMRLVADLIDPTPAGRTRARKRVDSLLTARRIGAAWEPKWDWPMHASPMFPVDTARHILWSAFQIVDRWPDSLETAVWLGQVLFDRLRPSIQAGRGRLREAYEALARSQDGQLAVTERLNYVLYDYAFVGATPSIVPQDTVAAYYDRLFRVGPAWQIMLLHSAWAAHGDTGKLLRAQRMWDSLVQVGSPSLDLQAEAEYAQNAVRGYLALVRGDTAAGAAHLARYAPPCWICVHDALALAELYVETGRARDAEALYGKRMYELAEPPMAMEVSIMLRHARLLERVGEPERAAQMFQYVADVWRNADPELQPYVAEAHGAVTRLAGRPPT